LKNKEVKKEVAFLRMATGRSGERLGDISSHLRCLACGLKIL
jgi:hypothetical protein